MAVCDVNGRVSLLYAYKTCKAVSSIRIPHLHPLPTHCLSHTSFPVPICAFLQPLLSPQVRYRPYDSSYFLVSCQVHISTSDLYANALLLIFPANLQRCCNCCRFSFTLVVTQIYLVCNQTPLLPLTV